MVDKSRRDRVGLGLIGLGPSWEQVYRETLVRLQNRLTIRVIYDSVEARARSVATEFDAEVVGSLRQMLTRESLQGLLVFDPGWCGAGALELIAKCRKPTFLGCPVLRIAPQSVLICRRLVGLKRATIQSPNMGDHLMPELGLRFTPASCRLRELMATKLGAARRIAIEGDLSADVVEIAAMVDWCLSMMGQEPELWRRADGDSLVDPGIDLTFPLSTGAHASSEVRTAKLRQNTGDPANLRIEIECHRGNAVLMNRTQINWKTPKESAEEVLTDERTETEILIDQFCRRALGGLNPVGQMSEFTKAIEIVEAIRGSV